MMQEKDNPFLKTAEFELAKYHYSKKNLDSADSIILKRAFDGTT